MLPGSLEDVDAGVLYVYGVKAVVDFLGNVSEAMEPVEIRSSESKSESEPVDNGPAQVGEMLTADTSSIADEDGLGNVSHSCQWQADGADMSGATGSSNTLTDTDEGKAVTATVSFNDAVGDRKCAGVPGRR